MLISSPNTPPVGLSLPALAPRTAPASGAPTKAAPARKGPTTGIAAVAAATPMPSFPPPISPAAPPVHAPMICFVSLLRSSVAMA